MLLQQSRAGAEQPETHKINGHLFSLMRANADGKDTIPKPEAKKDSLL